jgi:hypothetical protein
MVKQNEVQPPFVSLIKVDPAVFPENLEVLTVIKTTGVFALVLKKSAHYPLQFWEINSTPEDFTAIFIRTALAEHTLEVDKDRLCSMETVCLFMPLTATAALVNFQSHGNQHFVPEHVDKFCDRTSKVSEKSPESRMPRLSSDAAAAPRGPDDVPHAGDHRVLAARER